MKNIIGWILLACVLGFYSYGMFSAIEKSWPTGDQNIDPAIPEQLESFLSAIGALLLTNFGAVLGFALAKQNSLLGARMGLNRIDVNSEIPPTASQLQNIQTVAILVYLVVLVSCVITWMHNGYTSDTTQVSSLVSHTANTFFAVLIAYFGTLMAK